MKLFYTLLTCFFVAICGVMPEPAQGQEDPPKKYAFGRKPVPKWVLDILHDQARKRHGNLVANLPVATETEFLCTNVPGYVVLPIDDQGSCGSCYGVSSVDVCSMALARAGRVSPNESGRLASQYGMDCGGFQGGCDGGNEAQVIDDIKKKGFPLASDYGAYKARVGRCSYKDQKLYRIDDWGYCTPNQQDGPAAVQDMKNCIKKFGPISVAFDASGCSGYTGGVMRGRGDSVNHAVSCIGWSDSKQAFRMRNQWGTSWGEGGYAWIDYHSYSWGTEAIWVTAGEPIPKKLDWYIKRTDHDNAYSTCFVSILGTAGR